jgi:GTPase Era involved in 16S rRNA processing
MHIGNAKAINAYMNRVASSSINDVDIILWLVEAGKWTKKNARGFAPTSIGYIIGIKNIILLWQIF